jgi:hypothetical protein
MAADGIGIIKRLGPVVLPEPETQLRSLGSLYLADADGAEVLILSLALHLFNHSDFCASGGPADGRWRVLQG